MIAGFTTGLILRLAALAGAAAAFVLACLHPGLAATRVVAGLLVVAAAAALWAHVTRTNRELARFVAALRLGDLTQRFGGRSGGGFRALGQALDDAIGTLREKRGTADEEVRVQAALLDESPAALLLVEADGRVTLASKAARKLFDRLPGTRVQDFAGYGSELIELLGEGEAEHRLIHVAKDGASQRAAASRTLLDAGGRRLKVVAVQPIQQELSEVELAAQAGLVRVLTHEIMNSLTPIVSLAESAAALMEPLDCADPALADARLAVRALATRAAGIMHFVEAYRDFAEPPALDRHRFAVRPWAEQLVRLFAASEEGRDASVELAVEPADLMLDADPDLLAQVVINLLRNGAQAARAIAEPRLRVAAVLVPGGRARLTVGDNGPGIPPHLADEIFLPFFTTKADGTGVGLSLARRILAAHGGDLALARGGEGATFEMVL